MSQMYDKNQKIEKREGRTRVYTVNEEPTMTQQQFKDECDINNIMRKYDTTGQFTHLTSKQGMYGDFSQITDYQDMLHQVQYAQDAFASLPALVRAKFKNNPGELLEFIQDPKNYDEGVALGLLNPKPVPNDQIIPENQNPKSKPSNTKTKTQPITTEEPEK